MKKIFSLFSICYFISITCQVGINTPTPQASLDILSKGSTASTKALKITNSNNSEIVTVTDVGRVGIGATSPSGALHILTTSPNGIISERSSIPVSGGLTPAYIALRKNHSNDPAVNVAVVAGEALGIITFAGNTGDGYVGDPLSSNASIVGAASENFSASTQGSELRFNTVPNGTTSSRIRLTISNDGKVGIGRTATTNILEVAGDASKNTAGSWIANSDQRLKKDIQQIPKQEALHKLLELQGVYYYWNDDKTNISRPKNKQIGFIAQNIQEVFPDKVTKDSNGYLQTAYGDYDAIIVEAIRALNEKIINLEKENSMMKQKINTLLKQ